MTDRQTKGMPRQKRPWKRWLVKTGVGLLVLIIGLYFVGTSDIFIKRVVLPRVDRELNARVIVSGMEINPFSHIELRGIKVIPGGEKVLLSAAGVRVRYSLFSIFTGHLLVHNVAVESPVITIVQNTNSPNNLSPFLQTTASPSRNTKAAPNKQITLAKQSTPLLVDIKSILLHNATIKFIKNLPSGGNETIDLTGVDIAFDNIHNGGIGSLHFSLEAYLKKAMSNSSAKSTLTAKLKGAFTFHLDQRLQPDSIKGNTTSHIRNTTGDFADLTGLASNLDCNITPTNIEQLVLSFTKDSAPLGHVQISGPFNLSKLEGRLKMQAVSLDRQVLNLAGAMAGIDFDSTVVNTHDEIDLTNNGAIIRAAGTWDIDHLQVTSGQATSPTLELHCGYDVTVNRTTQSVLLKKLAIAGTQGRQSLLKVALTSPMTVALGKNSHAVNAGNSTLNLVVHDLDLADWKTFAKRYAPGGITNVKLKIRSQQEGKQLAFELNGDITRLSARGGAEKIRPVNVNLLVQGQAINLQKIDLSTYRVTLTRQNHSLLTAAGSGIFDRSTDDTDFLINAQGALERLIELIPQPHMVCSTGNLNVTGKITSQNQGKRFSGKITVADFTGGYSKYRLNHWGTSMDLVLAERGRQFIIEKAAGQLHEGRTNGGTFAFSGHYDLTTRLGRLTATLENFNQDDLGPFVNPSLGGMKLLSVALNTTASASFDALGHTTFNGNMQLADLVVKRSGKSAPATPPLALRLQIDASAGGETTVIHQCQLALEPTARAKNELNLDGTVTYAKTNAITGHLNLTSAALDISQYYDLLARTDYTNQTSTKPLATAPASAENSTANASSLDSVLQKKQPTPIILPLQNFLCRVGIDDLYLRKITIANLQTTMAVNGGDVLMKPCHLKLNGAPVQANLDLDLGVQGYRYDVSLNANKIPLTPLVDSFSPIYNDKAQGVLVANVHIKGAGITGCSLRKSLSGDATFNLTNANIQIVGPKTKKILTPIALVLGIPQILNSPLNYVMADIHFGDGQITTRKFVAHSAAFQAESRGSIPIANVLNNSRLSQPVDIELAKTIAGRFQLKNVTEDGGYEKLPTFVHLAGTLGDPAALIDKTVIVGLTANGVVGVVGTTAGTVGEKAGVVGKKAGGVLQRFSHLLNEHSPDSTNTSSDAANSGNPIKNLFKHFKW